MLKHKKQQGFSLVEIMVALALSSVLVFGVASVYVSIKSVVLTSKNIENAQEVLRFSALTFTRSLKQTSIKPTVAANQLSVVQRANTVACTGALQGADYTEVYTLNGINLQCDIGAGAQTILTGVQAISFSIVRNLVSITVTPKAQPGEPDGVGPTAPQVIDVALSLVILKKASES